MCSPSTSLQHTKFSSMYSQLVKLCPPTGWSLDCLQEWGQFTQVAIPSMFMLCLEWWTFEIGGLFAGTISEVELGAQSVVHQMVTIAYMVIHCN